MFLKSSASYNFPPLYICIEEIPPEVLLFCKRLHVFVTSFKHQNDVTPSNATTDVIFQWQMTSAGARFQDLDFVVSCNTIF